MKKILSIVLSFFLVVSLSGCGSKPEVHDLTDTIPVEHFNLMVDIPNHLNYSEDFSKNDIFIYDYVDGTAITERFAMLKYDSSDLDGFLQESVNSMEDVSLYEYNDSAYEVPCRSASFYDSELDMYCNANYFLIKDNIVVAVYLNKNKEDSERIFNSISSSFYVDQIN